LAEPELLFAEALLLVLLLLLLLLPQPATTIAIAATRAAKATLRRSSGLWRP
jgi:hypothetical protein